MKEDWWEKPTCWICDYWWLFLIILALLLSLIFFFGRPLLDLVGLGRSINRQLMDRVSDLIDLERDSIPSLTTGDITFTLIWHTTDDLDLWVTDPSGEKIYYDDPVSDSGGDVRA